MLSDRKKGFIWLFVFLAIGALLLVLIWRPTATDKWETTKKRLVELKAETESRKTSRAVLQGKPMPGNAWDEYNLVLEDGVPWKDDPNGAFLGQFTSGDPVDRAKLNRLLADHQQAIEHLRRGAQAANGQYPYHWEKGRVMNLPSLMGIRRLANLSVAQAKVWAEGGRSQDAADLLFDVSVFSKDVSTNGPLLTHLLGIAAYQITFNGFRDLIASGKLTQKQLADLAKRLEIVDRDFPALSPSFSNESLLFGLSLVEASEGNVWFRFKEEGARFALYPRKVTAETLEETDAYMRRFAKVDGMNFADAKKEADAISAEADTSQNKLIRYGIPSMTRSMQAHREALAHLRVIRAGTSFLATGTMPALADPFGEKLFYKQEGGKSKIWSVGRDGTNQNGQGNREGRPDIVLEIPR